MIMFLQSKNWLQSRGSATPRRRDILNSDHFLLVQKRLTCLCIVIVDGRARGTAATSLEIDRFHGSLSDRLQTALTRDLPGADDCFESVDGAMRASFSKHVQNSTVRAMHTPRREQIADG